MADGGNFAGGIVNLTVEDEGESLPRDGIHLLRRARSTVLPLNERRLDIHRLVKTTVDGKVRYQTPKVGTTGTADIEEAAVALKRYCLRDMEARLAQQREDNGKKPATDMLCNEVYVEYMLAKGEDNANADMFRGAIRDAKRAWAPNTRVSDVTRQLQKQFIEVNCKLATKPWHAPGEPEAEDVFHEDILPNDDPRRHYKDSSIESRLNLIFAMFRWAHAEGKQVSVPGKIRDKEWKAILESYKRPYTTEEMQAILNRAGRPIHRSRVMPYSNVRRSMRHELYWRGLMTWLNTGCRAMTGHDLKWSQLDVKERIVHLNPPGRAKTSKRRPMLPMTPTFAAEVESWLASDEVHHDWVCTFKGRHNRRQVWFDTVLQGAGVDYGSVQTLRQTVRTMFARKGVPNRIADRWTGHDEEEGADTGQQYYVLLGVGDDMRPFFQPCVDALEEWFDELQEGVDYPIGKRYARGRDPMRISMVVNASGQAFSAQGDGGRRGAVRGPNLGAAVLPHNVLLPMSPLSAATWGEVRSNCVASLTSNLLFGKGSEVN